MESPSGLAPFPHASPHSYGRVPVTDDTDDERFHDGGAVFGPRIGRLPRQDATIAPPSPLGSPHAHRRASEESATFSDSSTALQIKARSSSLPHRALDGTGPLFSGEDGGGGSPYMASSPLAVRIPPHPMPVFTAPPSTNALCSARLQHPGGPTQDSSLSRIQCRYIVIVFTAPNKCSCLTTPLTCTTCMHYWQHYWPQLHAHTSHLHHMHVPGATSR